MSEFRPLWPNGPLYSGESFGTDALALAAFAGEQPFRRGWDLGCGSGILLLLLAQMHPAAQLRGIELRPEAAEQCRANIAANGWAHRCRVSTGNLASLAAPEESVDLVVTNPPYFNGRPSPDPRRAAQRQESMPAADWFAAAARLLCPGGECCAVYPVQRMTDLLLALRTAGLEPKELRLIAHSPDKAPALLLCRAKKGGKPGLSVRPTLYQTDESGRETGEYRKICHWEAK